MFIGVNVKYTSFLSDLMKLRVSRQIFEKYSSVKFLENPSSETPVVPCGRRGRPNEANSRFSVFQTTAVEKIKTHFMVNNLFFPPKFVPFMK
jgi:hypothetical protein